MNKPENIGRFEVLSPWSEIDPIQALSPAPRLDTLSNKKIGLYCNFKRSAPPMLQVAERWLHEQYPDIETSFYQESHANVPEMESDRSEGFAAWLDAQDGVILAVGD